MARLPISERRKQIAQMVMEQGYISVRDLSDCFQVSTETIRKDLLDLEQKNIINKGHGDATISSTYQENPFDMKVYTHIESKAKIAEKAVGLIPEGGVVMVDSGSTNMQVAKLLNLKNGLVVVTNSLSAAQVLSGTSNQLLVIGGELRNKSLSFVGSWAANSLSTVRADIAFIGCDGFHNTGPSIRSYRELQIKQMMIDNAKKAVLVCDSSKLDNEGMYTVAEFNRFSCMITDSGITPEQKKKYSEKMELIIA